jgi:hypothetical protein
LVRDASSNTGILLGDRETVLAIAEVFALTCAKRDTTPAMLLIGDVVVVVDPDVRGFLALGAPTACVPVPCVVVVVVVVVVVAGSVTVVSTSIVSSRFRLRDNVEAGACASVGALVGLVLVKKRDNSVCV